MTDAEIATLSAPSAPRQLTDADIAELSASPRAAAATAAPKGSPGFFERAYDSIKHGVGAVASVGGDIIDTKGGALLDPEKRRQLERGIDDMVTLGYGQKLAGAIGRKLGDAPDVDLQATEAADQAKAPEYRTVGGIAGSFVPGAASALGGVGGKVAGKALGKVLPEAGGTVRQLLTGAAKATAGYEAAAPLTAALGAGAAGDRLGAAESAATDPAGLLLSTAAGGAGQAARAKVLGSRGAQAREFIEQRGGGTVTAGSAGKGGVFDAELAGVPPTDRGIGMAAKRGAAGINHALETSFEAEQGLPYRGGPAALKEASKDYRGAQAEARRGARAAQASYREELSGAKDAIRTGTASRAQDILGSINEDHRVETSEPYRVLKEQIDNSPGARQVRDVSELTAAMRDAVHDLDTSHKARAILREELDLLERYRPRLGVEGEHRFQSDLAEAAPIQIPERQLNALRRTLMREAKVGMNDAPGEAEAPLRRAAFIAKGLVDDGPYAALNKLYAEGSTKREVARQAVGLGRKQPKDKLADEKRLKMNLRRSVADDTALPGPLPAAADMSSARASLAAPAQARAARLGTISDDLTVAGQLRAATEAKVAKGAAAAIPDRTMLGLGEKVGARKVDLNQIRLALERQGGNSKSEGGSLADLEAFRKAHPELGLNIDLPELARARADLGFNAAPQHGGLATRVGGAVAGPGGVALATALGHGPLAATAYAALLAAHNKNAINGRLLYRPAKATNAAGIGARIGAASAARRKEKDGTP